MTVEEAPTQPIKKNRRVLRIAAVLFLCIMLGGAVLLWPGRVDVHATDIIGPAADIKLLVRVRGLSETMREQDRLRRGDWLDQALADLDAARGNKKAAPRGHKILRCLIECAAGRGFMVYMPKDDPEDVAPILIAPRGSLLRRIVRWTAIKMWKDDDGNRVCRWVDADGKNSALKPHLRGWWMIPLGTRTDEALRVAGLEAEKAPKLEDPQKIFGGDAEFIARDPKFDLAGIAGFIRPKNFKDLGALAEYPLISFRQTAPTLGNWEVRLGPTDFMRKPEFNLGSLSRADYLREEDRVDGPRPPIMLQMNGHRDFVNAFAKKAGIDLGDELGRLKDNDWIRPGLADALRKALESSALVGNDVRIGFALRPTSDDPIPVAEAWQYEADKLRGSALTPGDALPIVPPPATMPGVDYGTFGAMTRQKDSERQRAARRFFNRAWQSNAHDPNSKAFAAIDWYTLAESMAAFPAITLKKDRRESWLAHTAIAEALAAALDASTIRVEQDGEGLVLWIDSQPGVIPPSPPPPWPLKP